MATKKKVPGKRARDAKTGEYIPLSIAKRRPSTTVVETVSKPKPKSKKKK